METESVEEVFYEDYDTRSEVILQCYNSLMAIDLS